MSVAPIWSPTDIDRWLTAGATIIDARSEGEYAEDFLPGAINHPVLNNEERARVGTVNKVESPFAAKRVGAPLVVRNVADMIESISPACRRTGRRLSIAGAAASAPAR
jgi:tRNA 2-selenouridine synthase SelU